MPMTHSADNKLYCTHCRLFYPGGPTMVYHPGFKDVGPNLKLFSEVLTRDVNFLSRLKACPNAGKTWRFPEAVRLMDEEG